MNVINFPLQVCQAHVLHALMQPHGRILEQQAGAAGSAWPSAPAQPGSKRTREVLRRRSASGGRQRRCRNGRASSTHCQAHGPASAVALQTPLQSQYVNRRECNVQLTELL